MRKDLLAAYAISFLQGGVIMGYELLVPKLIAPFFGGSLYVWGCSIVFTMTGLAAGYYLSGVVIKKYTAEKVCRAALLGAMLFIVLITVLGARFNNLFLSMELKSGIILTSFVHLVPVLSCLGIVSPALIASVNDHQEKGKSAGFIFAVSTFAGIFFSLLTGFYLIPETGLLSTSFVLITTLFVAALMVRVLEKETVKDIE